MMSHTLSLVFISHCRPDHLSCHVKHVHSSERPFKCQVTVRVSPLCLFYILLSCFLINDTPYVTGVLILNFDYVFCIHIFTPPAHKYMFTMIVLFRYCDQLNWVIHIMEKSEGYISSVHVTCHTEAATWYRSWSCSVVFVMLAGFPLQSYSHWKWMSSPGLKSTMLISRSGQVCPEFVAEHKLLTVWRCCCVSSMSSKSLAHLQYLHILVHTCSLYCVFLFHSDFPQVFRD